MGPAEQPGGHEETLGHDDYSLSRVPKHARFPWYTVAVQRFGMLSALSQFLLGATLGFGMDFWTAFWAITLGAAILEIVSVFSGIMGMREGLSTSLLSRWAGFGRYGSGLIGLLVGISLIGWFGVQNAVFAKGVESLVGILPVWGWTIVCGALVTLVVIYGFLSMAWLAWITVPAFVVMTLYSVGTTLADTSLSELIGTEAAGDPLTLAAGATLVAGGFMVGAAISPDMTRFNRSTGDVIKQTVISFTLGEYLIGLTGVLLAHAVRSDDVIEIVTTTSGVLGTLILLTATLKINDWNLYSGSLGVVNLLNSTMNVRAGRVQVTIAVGILGTALSAAGILDAFIPFLTVLGVVVPPVAAIMIAEYFVVRRFRAELDESRARGELPREAEAWNPVTIVVWIAASLIGYYLDFGIPSLNSLVAAFVLYIVGMRLFGAAVPAATRQRESQVA